MLSAQGIAIRHKSVGAQAPPTKTVACAAQPGLSRRTPARAGWPGAPGTAGPRAAPSAA
ncbi:hypothetical protein [Lysobacter enzymogenes]|uniref:hypothetical protein n=1 Tax=Lysobacter enzymogenes TaxID=69 RepID=UPI0033922977